MNKTERFFFFPGSRQGRIPSTFQMSLSGCWGPQADVRNDEWCRGDSAVRVQSCCIQGQIKQSEHLPLVLPPTQAHNGQKKGLDQVPQSLPLLVAAAWYITAVAPRFLSRAINPPSDFYPALLKNTKFWLLSVSFAVTRFKIPPPDEKPFAN